MTELAIIAAATAPISSVEFLSCVRHAQLANKCAYNQAYFYSFGLHVFDFLKISISLELSLVIIKFIIIEKSFPDNKSIKSIRIIMCIKIETRTVFSTRKISFK